MLIVHLSVSKCYGGVNKEPVIKVISLANGYGNLSQNIHELCHLGKAGNLPPMRQTPTRFPVVMDKMETRRTGSKAQFHRLRQLACQSGASAPDYPLAAAKANLKSYVSRSLPRAEERRDADLRLAGSLGVAGDALRVRPDSKIRSFRRAL